ncbi:MAG TPA: MmcQ/YjbR family DNA-binding protein [Candidatus Onthoplasma faecipullorum]|nr:MmcQ/YjbR family DNA-binding protein [Candidatus Onthoplasma faecipullorum]
MIEKFFNNSNVDFNKLLDFGFNYDKNKYLFQKEILNNQFTLNICVDKNGTVSTNIIDNTTNEEYILHLMEDVGGEFVGNVRSEYYKVLTDIKERCFETHIFKSSQSKAVIEYIKNQYGDELEFLWPKFPNNAIWRRKDNKKWYSLIISLPRNKLKQAGDGIVEIIDVRITEDDLKLIDNKSILEAYHMNKKHWITLIMDNSLDNAFVFKLIDKSYILAKNKK